MIYAMSVAAMTFVATLLAGRPFIGLLRHFNIEKDMNLVGPESHKRKAGTPTMGGLLIVGAVVVITSAINLAGKESIGLLLAATVAFAAIGLVDDLGSLQGRQRRSLNKRVKFLALIAIGLATAFGLHTGLDLHTVKVPYIGNFSVGAAYVPIAVAVIVLTAGGVAVSDGLDGLAGGATSTVFIAYGTIALIQDQESLATFCFTMAAATLAFLWYNSHPAQMFMGDVGALALGGSLATVAFMTEHWLLLPIVGVVFLLEGASDVVQVITFRLTGGRRFLKMAPLHHHLELSAWSEVQVVQRLWLVGLLGTITGTILALEVMR